MKLTVLSLAFAMLLFTGCEKDDPESNTITEVELQTGTYSGKYEERDGIVTPIYQFEINVTKINDSVYNVAQITPGNLPSFNMVKGSVSGSNTTSKTKYRILRQTVGTSEITGDARIANGYDAYWISADKSLQFGIVFDNNPQHYIRFVGIKK